MMAARRTKAFLDTGNTDLTGVASRSFGNAEAFATRHSCGFFTTDFRDLAESDPDFILVETPHLAQRKVVSWALKQKYHMLIGSCMAVNMRDMKSIRLAAARHHLVLEGGFEARYSEVWRQAKDVIRSGRLGEVSAVQATACWAARTNSWYYSELQSGGMPLTHMTYAFLNPITWLFGMPRKLSAMANSIGEQVPGMVNEVTCVANMQYDNGMLCTLLASYIHHPSSPAWKILIQGTGGAMELLPGEFGGGRLVLHSKEGRPVDLDFSASPDPFKVQAEVVIEAVRGGENLLQNNPDQAIQDVTLAAAIVRSARTAKTLTLPPPAFQPQGNPT